MRKITLIFIFLLLIISTNAQLTGKNIENNIGLSVNVAAPTPILEVSSPINGTYITNNLILKYSAQNTNNILISLNDNSNFSISGPANLNLANGNYIINIYAIGNNKTIRIQRNITINTNKFMIIYDNYKLKNETTQFEQIPFEEYLNIKNVSLQTEYGKIDFEEFISIPKDLIDNDSTINLDINSHIIQNEVYINETALPNFNKKAIITLYNITFIEPIIKKNGQNCSNCEIISFNNNLFKFKVQSFSKYEIIEGYSESNNQNDQGSSNKKTDEEKNSNLFIISPNKIIETLKQNTTKNISINLKNKKNKKIEITTINNLTHIIQIPSKIILEANEEKNIMLQIKIPTNEKPSIISNYIKFQSENQEEKIWLILSIISNNSLLDAQTDIAKKTKEFSPGEKIKIISSLYNLGDTEIEAILKYEILDYNQKRRILSEEKINFNKEINLTKNLYIPKNTPDGEYILTLTIEYNNKTAFTTNSFNVKKEYNCFLLLILTIILILILIMKNYNSNESKSRGK